MYSILKVTFCILFAKIFKNLLDNLKIYGYNKQYSKICDVNLGFALYIKSGIC